MAGKKERTRGERHPGRGERIQKRENVWNREKEQGLISHTP
jgi:hypothetical protein